MNRRHFTLGTLLGLLGVKVAAQEPGSFSTLKCPAGEEPALPVTMSPDGTVKFGEEHCIDRITPPKPGEEYCPLEHVQKPRIFTFQEVGVFTMQSGRFGEVMLHVCSVCGTVYVPPARQQKH